MNCQRERVILEQAKGVLAEREGIGVDAAFARLRAYAGAHDLRLADVARAVVTGDTDRDAAAHPAPTQTDAN